MKHLPKWCITDKFPALYDTESATAIEMVAKIYGAMNEMIEDYNKWVDNTNKHIEDFENDVTADVETFKVAMRQEFQDFIDVIDLRMQSAENFMRDNIESTVIKLVEKGDIIMTANYDDTTESLNFILTT